MARPLRIIDLAAWHHVTARGNERRDIFRDNRDRRKFLELLAEISDQFELQIHAYVLMDNHYHLLLQLRQPTLSRAMQWLNATYTTWFNRRHERCGHLFQGRFKSVLVDPTTWALGMGAYIHLNPVRVQSLGLDKNHIATARASRVNSPTSELIRARLQTLRAHTWSSYRAYAGLSAKPPWLDTAETYRLAAMDRPVKEAPAKYRAYIETQLREGMPLRPWEELADQLALGPAKFLTDMRKRIAAGAAKLIGETATRRRATKHATLPEIIAATEQILGQRWSEFRDRHGHPGRNMALYAARRLTSLTLSQIAEAAGLASDRSAWMAIQRHATALRKSKSHRAQTAQILEKWNVEL